MKLYEQLTYEQRCQIEALKKSGISQQVIATLLEVNQSSISRELSRNTGSRGYHHNQAHHKSVDRRQETVKSHKMTAQLIDEIEDKLLLKWSPEQISGWLLVNQSTCSRR
jgi:IS30 family transposase